MTRQWFFLIFLSYIGVASVALSEAFASDPRSVYSNRSGVKALIDKKAASSQNDFLKALETEPQEARLHINLGIAYQANKDLERAVKEFQTALRFAQSDEIKFYANFNTAQALGSKNLDLALRYYQNALQFNPDSTETKHNIELLMQSKNGGGGEGDQENKEKKPEEEDKGQDRSNERRPNEPEPYKGKELKEQDVQNILDELKNQDQRVRAKENSSAKERSLDKDW